MSTSLERYKNTYSYKELIKKYSLDQVGIWEVRGEDANCDFGGSHHMPVLFHVHGKLQEVIENAVEQKGFWTWGAGGDFRLIRVLPIDELKNLTFLEQEKRSLEERIKQINKLIDKS
jgi:hypothetical protein